MVPGSGVQAIGWGQYSENVLNLENLLLFYHIYLRKLNA